MGPLMQTEPVADPCAHLAALNCTGVRVALFASSEADSPILGLL